MTNRISALLARPRILAVVFLLCALPAGLGCALLTPIGDAPDEPQHIARADGLRLGEILGFQVPGVHDAGVTINLAVFQVAVSEIYETLPSASGGPAYHALTKATRQAAGAIPWTRQTLFCPTQMVHYLPSFYIPGALGLLAGETLGLTPLHTVFLGRVLMLLSFLALAAAAIGLARFGNLLLFAVLTLPTTLVLAASYNQDGLVIASCALAAALATRLRPGPNALWFVPVLLLSLVGCAKTPYAAMLLSYVSPLGARRRARRALIVLLCALPPVLWLLWLLHGNFSPWPRPPYHPGPLWPGNRDVWFTAAAPHDNVLVLAAHPLQILLLPLLSLAAKWPTTWPDTLGMISWGNVRLPGWEYPGLAVSFIAAALASAAARGPEGWTWRDYALAGLGLFGAFIGTELSQYVTFSNAGAALIDSVYGRYYLPFLPFFILILPALGRALPRLPGGGPARLAGGILALPALAMAAVNIVVLPGFIYHLYQMPGP